MSKIGGKIGVSVSSTEELIRKIRSGELKSVDFPNLSKEQVIQRVLNLEPVKNIDNIMLDIAKRNNEIM